MTDIWQNGSIMIPIVTTSVDCNSVNCQTMTCQTMDITNIDFTTITGNECDFNNVNCGNLGATGPANLNSITGTSLTINNDTVLNNLRLQTLNVNNTFNHAVVHDPTTTQLFHKDDFVDTTQTQTLLNKTLIQPTITQINNGGLLTIPTGPGTIAKITDIPSPATYATLTGTQTLLNKTLVQPTISQILNGSGTLTLPSNTNATLATTNDLIGFVTQTGTATLINKTINTNGPNSILVNNVNITALIDQDVRATAAPTFAGITTTVGGTFRGTRPISPTSAGVYIGENGPGDYALEIVAAAGSNNSYIDFGLPNVDNSGRILYAHSTGNLNLTATNFVTAGPNCILSGVVRIGTTPTNAGTFSDVMIRDNTNGNIRIRNDFVDLATGQTLTNKILTQPTISQILNGTGTLTLPANTNATLATTNDLIGFATTTTSQVLLNKTINTNGPNSILVNNVNITTLLNQDVRNTASPVFVNPAANTWSLNNSSAAKKYESRVWTVTSNDNSVLDVLTINVNNNSAATVTTTCTFYVSLGTNINKAGSRLYTTRGSNVAGSVTMSGIIQNIANNEGGLNGVLINHQAITNTIRVTFAGLIGDTMFASGTTEIFYN